MDASGNSSGCSFQVTVRSPAEQGTVIEGVIRELIGRGILSSSNGKGKGGGNGLLAKLENALASLERGQTKASCNQLGAFENQVEDLVADGALPPADGDMLLAELALLQEGLGCSR